MLWSLLPFSGFKAPVEAPDQKSDLPDPEEAQRERCPLQVSAAHQRRPASGALRERRRGKPSITRVGDNLPKAPSSVRDAD
eukprot:scaffold2544_cov245-Pinguiococcus_pyrenoidosus.AAC.6